MALDIKKMINFVKENDIENQLYVSAKYLTKKGDITLKVQGTQSYTDLENIVIGYPTYVEIGTVEELLIFLKAHNGHESQHILSSSISGMTAIVDKVEKEFSKRRINKNATKETVHFILNSLEDGRIENILVNSRKGFLKYIKYFRYRFYNNYEIKGTESSELYDFLNSILVYATTGLLPIGFEKYKGKRLEEEFLNIKDNIDEAIYAVTCQECMKIGYKIMMKSIDYLETLIKKESKDIDSDKLMKPGTFNTDEEQEFNTSHEYSGRINDVGEDDKGEENEKDESKEDESKEDVEGSKENSGSKKNEGKSDKDGEGKEGEETGEDGESEDGCGDCSSLGKEEQEGNKASKINEAHKGKRDTETNKKEKRDEAFKEIFEELKKDVESDIEKGREDKKKKDKEKQKEEEFELTKEDLKEIKEANKLFKEAVEGLKIKKVYAPHHELPQSMKNKANKFNREITEILYEKQKPVRRNQRRGMLDTKALYRFEAFDANDIFIKKGDSKEFNAVFYFLVDGSGSMCADKKWEYAMETMAILEEGLKTIVETKIAVFKTGWNDDNPLHLVIKDYGEKKGVNSSYDAYKSKKVIAESNNKDGANIRIATKELEKRNESQKILFILSDGVPSGCYYTGPEAMEDVKEAVKDAKNKGIEVIPIMFGNERFRRESFEDYKVMYEKNIISTEPEKIFSKTIRVLKNIFAS